MLAGIRHKRTQAKAAPLDAVAEATIAMEAPQDGLIRTSAMIRAVARLPQELRSVLLLITMNDLSYADVAWVLDIPIGTVMSRLSHARERLRRDI
jgi:RNA polymerase sigma-70 factor (ECF subfamily)